MSTQPGIAAPPVVESSQESSQERFAWLAWLPVLSTSLYYLLPLHLQANLAIQFLPQALAYFCLLLWASQNHDPGRKLGLAPGMIGQSLRWGLPTGLLLGALNVSVILYLVPLSGGDITCLRRTPHAQVPTALMLPWFILFIALFVELNFRGFLLGRLLTLVPSGPLRAPGMAFAIGLSALVFAFDPFMVATFAHLHWIAVWDGLIWGIIWVRLRNLYATIAAHGVEVIVMYSILKAVLA
ncbi:MAG: type II CAAX prenyl endopeptidase Rce1 family protein [Nitrospiraceae bacterium]